MTTVLDAIKDAMQESGILTKDQDPTNDEAQAGLRMLNRILSSWSNSSALQFERETESFSLTSGTSSYTIGSGGVFNTVRPTNIIQAHVRQGTTDYNLEVIPDNRYQAIINKSTLGIPELLNFTNEYPLGTIRLYPTAGAGYTLILTSEKPLGSYSTTASTISLPSGWLDALIYALAVRLRRIYGLPSDPDLNALAKESRAMIALNVIKNNPIRHKPLFESGYDFKSRSF